MWTILSHLTQRAPVKTRSCSSLRLSRFLNLLWIFFKSLQMKDIWYIYRFVCAKLPFFCVIFEKFRKMHSAAFETYNGERCKTGSDQGLARNHLVQNIWAPVSKLLAQPPTSAVHSTMRVQMSAACRTSGLPEWFVWKWSLDWPWQMAYRVCEVTTSNSSSIRIWLLQLEWYWGLRLVPCTHHPVSGLQSATHKLPLEVDCKLYSIFSPNSQ